MYAHTDRHIHANENNTSPKKMFRQVTKKKKKKIKLTCSKAETICKEIGDWGTAGVEHLLRWLLRGPHQADYVSPDAGGVHHGCHSIEVRLVFLLSQRLQLHPLG